MRVASLVLMSAGCAAKDIVLATFDGAAGTTHTWKENNDPVMGGQSTGTTTIKDGVLVFDGTVAIVPSLKAPGFITSASTDSNPWPDITGCEAISMNLMSSVPFKGYRLNFGHGHPIWGKFFAYGYKSHFDAPVGKFGNVVIPLKNFTDYWDDATGQPIKTCQDNSMYCPNEKTLKNLQSMGFWGEGVQGKVHLEVKSVSATGCKDTQPVQATPKADYVDLMGDKKWSAECDPVMGGQSVAKWDQSNHTFSGEVKIVPSLKAPGFCIALTGSPLVASFPDASSYDGLALGLNNHGPVTSFKAAFCTSRINFECQFKSFKADFNETVSGGEAFIPWSAFSDKWSSATGEPTSHNPPTTDNLKSITQLQLWVEGLAGKFDVEIKYVRARKAKN